MTKKWKRLAHWKGWLSPTSYLSPDCRRTLLRSGHRSLRPSAGQTRVTLDKWCRPPFNGGVITHWLKRGFQIVIGLLPLSLCGMSSVAETSSWKKYYEVNERVILAQDQKTLSQTPPVISVPERSNEMPKFNNGRQTFPSHSASRILINWHQHAHDILADDFIPKIKRMGIADIALLGGAISDNRLLDLFSARVLGALVNQRFGIASACRTIATIERHLTLRIVLFASDDVATPEQTTTCRLLVERFIGIDDISDEEIRRAISTALEKTDLLRRSTPSALIGRFAALSYSKHTYTYLDYMAPHSTSVQVNEIRLWIRKFRESPLVDQVVSEITLLFDELARDDELQTRLPIELGGSQQLILDLNFRSKLTVLGAILIRQNYPKSDANDNRKLVELWRQTCRSSGAQKVVPFSEVGIYYVCSSNATLSGDAWWGVLLCSDYDLPNSGASVDKLLRDLKRLLLSSEQSRH